MLKIISVNIQRDFHHDKVLPFLRNEKPDILCLQETFEDELYLYEEALQMESFFKPVVYEERLPSSNKKDRGLLGVAILSKKIASTGYSYIVGTKDSIPIFKHTASMTERNTTNIAVIWASVLDSTGNSYTVANTHFTWTPFGASTEYQRDDARKLIDVLDNSVKEFALLGDMNAHRGFETYPLWAERYKDNIPKEYESSLDPELHRVKDLKRMVDVLFTTPEYKASDVHFVAGVSDHMALVAFIEKVK